jgi:hypothetical protein
MPMEGHNKEIANEKVDRDKSPLQTGTSTGLT